jgi:hypothetical protein
MARTTYENSVSLGNVLTILALLLGLLGSAADIKARITVLENKIDPLWSAFTNRERYGYER